jgi:Reverse transcriptase (RNA-dependent DNA polymerase)
MRVVDVISNRFNQNMSTGMVLIDIEKAFDSVWHDALLFKLARYKIPTFLIKIVQSFLSNRESFVSVGSASSARYLVRARVPQGSPLSPHLFNLFNNDIPVPKGCKIATFADDEAISK